MRVVCSIDKPEPLAYLDVFEVGDEWVKFKGCDGCENIKICCGNCKLLYEKGCALHNEARGKPYFCVIFPTPDTNLKWCQLEFKCIKGSNEGKIKRVKDVNMA